MVALTCAAELLATEDEFDSLKPEWEELFGGAVNSSFFLRWAWCRLWWSMYAPQRSRLYLLACRSESGKLLGIAPLYWQQRSFAGVRHIRDINFIGTGIALKTSEHLDILARIGAEKIVATAFAEFLAESKVWDRLSLWGVDENSKTMLLFAETLGNEVDFSRIDRLPYIRTDAPWTDASKQFNNNLRRNIKNGARDISNRHALTFCRARTRNEMGVAYAELVRLHQIRWTAKGKSGSFSIPNFEVFLRAAVMEAFDAGRVRLWTYWVDQKCAAALVAFVQNGTAHYFQSGFDMKYSKYRIGSLMIALCIQDCIADPEIQEFDFMGGGGEYKDWWTQESRKAVELTVFRPGWRTWLYQAGKRSRRRLGQLKRAVVVKRA